jgi:folate-binding protein YgfZ
VAGTLALEALRVAAWRPRFAREVDARSIPHELDWLRSAVHLAKGCYRGQETVAKVHNLGRPPRRLVQLDLDGSEAVLPLPGDTVLDGDQEVGSVTSSALHHEEGPIALAVVKRSVPEAATLLVRTADADVAAAQRVIVPADAGPAVAVPRLPRLGAVRRG